MSDIDLYREKYTNRTIRLYNKANQLVVGILGVDSDTFLSNTIAIWKEEIMPDGSISSKKKIISSTGILHTFDEDPLWNECPKCKAKEGDFCSSSKTFCEERFSESLIKSAIAD